METNQILRILLVITEILLVAMAIVRLWQRHLPWFDFIAWLLLTLFVPFFGPFLTISQRSAPLFQGENIKIERPKKTNPTRTNKNLP